MATILFTNFISNVKSH